MKLLSVVFVACDESEVAKGCQILLRRLFPSLEDAIFGGKKYISFEMLLGKYCL